MVWEETERKRHCVSAYGEACQVYMEHSLRSMLWLADHDRNRADHEPDNG
jgi:hypothetical protein